ncbi:MAG: helix-turn-helix domain-containing protein [Sarcina sp.]
MDKEVLEGKRGFFIELNRNFNIKNIEKILIEKSLSCNNYNMSKTAKELGVSRNTLYYKINKYNINH